MFHEGKLTQNKQFHAVACGNCNRIMVDEVTNISSTLDSLSCDQLRKQRVQAVVSNVTLSWTNFKVPPLMLSTDLQQVDLQFEIHKQESTQNP
jgi:hypothetical protein